jgi:ATP-dependent RNA helicase DDX56/DBP9
VRSTVVRLTPNKTDSLKMSEVQETDPEKKIIAFHQMNLDDRLLKAIAKLGWVSPTLIQEKGIPLFLEGKDVLAKGRTGSGKTAVFAIPIIQNILTEKQTAKDQVTRALILAPTKELCQQLYKAFLSFTTSCSRDVSIVNVGSQVNFLSECL